MALSTAHIFTVEASLGPAVDVGETPSGHRRVIPIIGGVVSGGLDGTVLPGGADWNVVRPDGSTQLWARYELLLADGTVVSVVNTAVHAAGAAFPILTSPSFDVGSGGPEWLRNGVYVGVLRPGSTDPSVRIEIHQVSA